MNLLDGGEQFGRGFVLQDVTARAGAEGIENQVAVLVGGEHQHPQSRHGGLEFDNAINAAHAREIDVHEQHLGLFGRDVEQRGFAGGMRAQQAHAGSAAQQRDEALARFAVVFDNGN